MREEELKFSVNDESVLPEPAALAPRGGEVAQVGTRRLPAT
ncbi:hypothetical protein [Amycolatopsis alkalitolerans]|nr:hypothetical protein [Amycolatopsis alkalitolerans]